MRANLGKNAFSCKNISQIILQPVNSPAFAILYLTPNRILLRLTPYDFTPSNAKWIYLPFGKGRVAEKSDWEACKVATKVGIRCRPPSWNCCDVTAWLSNCVLYNVPRILFTKQSFVRSVASQTVMFIISNHYKNLFAVRSASTSTYGILRMPASWLEHNSRRSYKWCFTRDSGY